MSQLKGTMIQSLIGKTIAATACLVLLLMMIGPVAQAADNGALGTVAVPTQPNIGTYVQNHQALVALGKSLFWDMQQGSDGKSGCATCHFHAGADHRNINQMNPRNGTFTANHTLTPKDFPMNGANAAVVGSAGQFTRTFIDVSPFKAVDNAMSSPIVDINQPQTNPVYQVATAAGAQVSVRQVTGRNTPSVINSIFNARNFWDSRAHTIFSGFTPFGVSDPSPHTVLESNGTMVDTLLRVDDSSTASQSVGPPLNGVEQSAAGRSWPKLGKKMLMLSPLAKQMVSPTDSVLGTYANPNQPGLNVSYASMIQAAIQPKYWNSTRLVDVSGTDLNISGAPNNTDQYSQMEFNFAMIWGLAIDAYESTLVSSQSRYDLFEAGDKSQLTAAEQKGMGIFQGKGQCAVCHAGPEFTAAAFTSVNKLGPKTGVSGGNTDTGYFRTGVRPIADDIGIGGTDGFGLPLSLVGGNSVKGAFKTPGLRNVELTGPYLHNGGLATLDQVVDFYSKGGFFPQDGNLGPGIKPLNFSADEHQSLVAFLKSLTDDRVRYEKAPFDHPQFCVANGAQMPISVNTTDPRFVNESVDNMVEMSVTGASGHTAPLQTFGELIGAETASGPRFNDLKTACTIQ